MGGDAEPGIFCRYSIWYDYSPFLKRLVKTLLIHSGKRKGGEGAGQLGGYERLSSGNRANDFSYNLRELPAAPRHMLPSYGKLKVDGFTDGYWECDAMGAGIFKVTEKCLIISFPAPAYDKWIKTVLVFGFCPEEGGSFWTAEPFVTIPGIEIAPERLYIQRNHARCMGPINGGEDMVASRQSTYFGYGHD